MAGHEPSEERDASGPAAEGRLERRVWIVLYVVIVVFLAAGAARRIWAMF